MAKPKGRPTGSKNAEYENATGELTRCPKCGSTDRSEYIGSPNVTEYHGLDDQGREYTHIVRRRTRCANPDCQQMRFDMHRENRAPARKKSGS